MELNVLSRFLFCTLIILSVAIHNNTNAADKLFYEVIEATDQRNVSATAFARVLSGNSQKDQREALLGLGRIGDKTSTLKISPFLYSKQPDIRAMAAFSLGISNDSKAHNLLLMRLKSEQHPVVISRLLIAIGNIADPKSAIASILPFLDHPNQDVVASACDGLTMAWTFHRETVSVPNSTQVTRLLELSQLQEPIATHCLFTLSRLRRDSALFDVKQLQQSYKKQTSIEAKVLVIRIIGAMKNPVFIEQLKRLIEPEENLRIRAEAATAIALLDYQDNLLASLEQLSNDSSSLVKINLIDNLTLTADNKSLLDIAKHLLNDKSQWVRHRAILALFAVKGHEMGTQFLKLLKADDFQSQQLALQILRQYQLAEPEQHLKVLAYSKHKGIASIASRLLNNEDADTEIYGEPKKTIPANEAVALAGKKLEIVTSRGPVTIQLLTSAPYTSANFYQLALSGYYDGLTFHRVIANFVVQGGDPQGTGQGGPGYSVREELYPVEHKRGTIGIATSGKDTGGSQFFFNNSDNIHLNGHYTVFARILHGIDRIDNLEVGDKIIRINEVK